MKQEQATVISNEQILGELERYRAGTFNRSAARNTLGSHIIWLRCPEIAKEAKPGQFVMIHCGGECVLPRPFSIHQANSDGIALFFTVWEDGKGTKWLSQRHKDDKVELFGPLGNGFSINPAAKNLLLVAGGIGIAPLWFLAQHAKGLGYKVKLLEGASGEYKPSGEPNPAQLYPRKLLPNNIEVHTITTSPDGKTGMVLELLPQHIDWADQVFACGPVEMYREMSRKGEKLLKGKPVQISLEVRMGCGLGACYGCTVKTKRGLKQVCQDGPIFDLDDILWEELV